MMQFKNKISCQCEIGHCFLAKDAAWSKQNVAKSENGFCPDVALLNNLEIERLKKKMNGWITWA